MRFLKTSSKSFIAILIIGFNFKVSAQVIDFDYGLFTRVTHSDNLAQVSPDAGLTVEEESGNAATAGFDFELESNRNNSVAVSMSGGLSRTTYSLDSLSEDDEKRFEGSFIYRPENRNFQLALFDAYDQVEIDRLASQSVNNTRDVHTFAAIPSYFIRLSSISQLNMDYQYTKVDDRDGLSSSDEQAVTLGYEKQFLSDAAWSLNLRKANTEFEDFETEFDQEEVFVGFSSGSGFTLFDLQMGRQRTVSADDQDQDYSYQNALRFSVNRRINSFSSANLVFRQGFGDFLNVDLENSLVQISANDQAGIIDGIVKEKQLSLDYLYTNRSLNLNLSLGGRSLESDDDIIGNTSLIDEDRVFVILQVSDSLSDGFGFWSSVNYSFNYQYEKSTFNIDQVDREFSEVQLGLVFQNSQNIESFIEISSRNVVGVGQGGDFDENRVSVGLRFSPRGL